MAVLTIGLWTIPTLTGIGAAAGALIDYSFQVWANISRDGLQAQDFINVDWVSVGVSAVAGAVAGPLFYLTTAGFAAAIGTTGIGLGTMALSGALSGAVSGQVERATANVLKGRPVSEGLGQKGDLLIDALLGSVIAFGGGVVDRAVVKARFPGYYTRYVGEGELAAIRQTGLLRGGRPGRTYITIDRFETSKEALERLSLPDPPAYRIEFKIMNQPRLHGPQRTRPWFWPRDPGFRGGWGIEFWTEDPVRIQILSITRLR